MKCGSLCGAVFLLLVLASCENGPVRSSYRLVLPELPPYWEEILGEARWRLEWVGDGGNWRVREIACGRDAPELPLVQEWTTPVLAWPFWPERGLLPGMMRPSGALFPWDCSGEKLKLSWKGGIDALFWKEFAAGDFSSDAAKKRYPWYFDWLRFRDLLYESGNIPEPVRLDPWLADWNSIAQRTVQSGFDRRRIVSRSFIELTIPGSGGRWIGSSPFAPPLDAPPEGPLVLPAADVPDTWVSSGAVIKCSKSGWVLSLQ